MKIDESKFEALKTLESEIKSLKTMLEEVESTKNEIKKGEYLEKIVGLNNEIHAKSLERLCFYQEILEMLGELPSTAAKIIKLRKLKEKPWKEISFETELTLQYCCQIYSKFIKKA